MSRQGEGWAHAALRLTAHQDRAASKDQALGRRRFSDAGNDEGEELALAAILPRLAAADYKDEALLAKLKARLASGEDAPDAVLAQSGALPGLVDLLTGAEDASTRLLATQCVANLAPLAEKDGVKLARAAGPYLVALLAGGSTRLQEAAAVALGNLALAGPKVVKVLLNQEAVESLLGALSSSTFDAVQASALFALYHVLHDTTVAERHLVSLVGLCSDKMSAKAPVELSWVLFVLSCNTGLHGLLSEETLVTRALDICTYEIFQKSDSRPLVKIVTPLVRFLSNLCAGAYAESVCLAVLRYPDLLPIGMALLGTNYAHLCKETLCWLSNVVNSDSVVVQEELVELDFLDKMEFHTVQAIQKLDPYLTNVIR